MGLFDKNEKKSIYQNLMHVPEYYWFDPFNPQDWAGFQLQGGQYQPIEPNAQGQMVSQVLDLTLVQWQGTFKQVEATWLRWAQLDGSILLTATEQEHQRADQEHQRAEGERQRAEQAGAQIQQIAHSLLQTGMSIAQVAETTGLSTEHLQTLI